MPLAAARSLLPDLRTAPEDAMADRAALERLLRWCGRYTPWVAEDPDCALLTGGLGGEAALLLDITGCAHLFGGEAVLADDLLARLARSGLGARLGIAPTLGAAWALARHATDAKAPAAILPPGGDLAAALAGLPVTGLRLPGEATELLARLGLRRIGQLYDLAPAALTPRFGPLVTRRLRQALGTLAEPLGPAQPPDLPWVRRGFAEPIATPEDVARALSLLLAELCDLLERRGLGARRVEARGYRVDGTEARLAIGLAQPSRALRHLERLFAPQRERLEAGFGFEVMTLAAPQVEPLGARQSGLERLGDEAAPAEDLAALIDRLDNRLGAGSVRRPALHESHWPEDAALRAASFAELAAEPPRARLPRPLYLLRRPEPVEVLAEVPEGPPVRLIWRRRRLALSRAEGPERILPAWWQPVRAGESPRDYYRVEDEAGHRYWLYRAGERWFLQGIFA